MIPRGQYQKQYHQQVNKPRRKAKANAISPSPGEKQILCAVRMPESIVARAHRMKEEAIVNGRYPWRTMSEVWRGLVYKGLESMKGDSVVDDGLPYLQLVKHVEGLRSPRTEAEAALHTGRLELRRLLEIGAKREAVQFYWTMVEIAKQMAATVWRDWLLEQLEKQYPELHAANVSGVALRKPGSRVIRGVK